MARLTSLTLLLMIVVTEVAIATDEGANLVGLLKRLLSEQNEEASCANRYEGKRATRGLMFTSCSTDADCKSYELCCPTQFIDVCIKKDHLLPNKQGKTTTTAPPPPPTVNVPVNDESTSGLCSTLPKPSLYARALTGLANMLQKREPLISVTMCKESALNKQGECGYKEVCCESPFGPSCYPLSDTSAGSHVWCKQGELCKR